jgi:glyceraldehyde-3-phosphate dehydrogenase/erythrose-4-phosphate dehydrogenase
MDLRLTRVVGGRLVKVFGWHDNETAYAARLCELVRHLDGETGS